MTKQSYFYLNGILRALEQDEVKAAQYLLASYHEEARAELRDLLPKQKPDEPDGQ
jgi:hypothetical protein